MAKKTKAAMKKVLGQPSWRLANDAVEAWVTETGGHVGPVSFKLGRRTIEPYSVAPWATEKVDPKLPPMLRVLRGDFFCLPFGGNATPFGKERHPGHGETASARWKFESLDQGQQRICLHLSLRTKIRRGRVDKRLCLVKGQRAIYCQDIISEMSGPMTLGHHAMLRFPDEPGSGIISTSPFVYGQVFPKQFEFPEQQGYSLLKPGAEITTLSSVETITGERADLTRYPARRGFEDLIMLASETSVPFAWTAVTFPKQRYVWFALKDPNVLRSTIFWMSNGGRYMAPWSGRHINVIGLEEVTGNFHQGLAESAADNPISQRGIATKVDLSPDRPLAVNYIMAVAQVPEGFDEVAGIDPSADGRGVTLRSAAGAAVNVPLDVDFLHSTAGAE